MCKRFTLRSSILAALCYTITIGSTFSETLLDNGENPNIIKVLNTSERLWLWWQTDIDYVKIEVLYDNEVTEIQDHETCTYIVKDGISNEEYNFTVVAVLDVEGLASEKYYGKFVNNTDPPKSMTVKNEEDQDHKLMTLEYDDPPPNKCHVFFVSPLDPTIPSDVAACEVYIPDSHLRQGPSANCKKFFEERCNTTTVYTPYKEVCKSKV
ncbi:hypothetical protein MTO96_038904 [Rhipicephalus appendiculatus]